MQFLLFYGDQNTSFSTNHDPIVSDWILIHPLSQVSGGNWVVTIDLDTFQIHYNPDYIRGAKWIRVTIDELMDGFKHP